MEPKLSASHFGFTAPCLGTAGSPKAPSCPRLSSGSAPPSSGVTRTDPQPNLCWHMAPAQQGHLRHLPSISRTSWHKGSQSHLPFSGLGQQHRALLALGPCSSSAEGTELVQCWSQHSPMASLLALAATKTRNFCDSSVNMEQGDGELEQKESLAGRKYSHPLVSCDF